MASESISSALFIIAGVIAATILISAVLPAIFSVGNTFSTVAGSTEDRMRTDFKIVNTFASSSTHQSEIWLKNVGPNPISDYELKRLDVFIGDDDSVKRVSYATSLTDDTYIYDGTSGDWSIGETLHLTIQSPSEIHSSNQNVYFSMVTPNGVRRSTRFTTITG